MMKSPANRLLLIIGILTLAGMAFHLQAEAGTVTVTFSERSLLALEQRTPLGARFSSGLILLNAGSEPYQSQDGASWKPVAPGYTTGSWQLTAETDAGKMVAFSPAALIWNAGAGRYESTVSVYTSPAGALETSLPFTVTGLGPLTGQLYPGMVVRHNGILHLTLWHYYSNAETWRGEIVPNARVIASYLARAVDAADIQSFQFVSEIASKATYPTGGPFRLHLPVVMAEWLAAGEAFPVRSTSEILPLYYAAEPELISLGPDRLVAAMRTTADDDDAFRPLDPDEIFSSADDSFTDRAAVFWGAEAVPGVWSPALEPDLYYTGSQPQPGILLAISDDSGATWSRQLLPDGGILPQLAYDPVSGVLVLAYGGVEYPRRGHAVQISTDLGGSWSAPIWLPDAIDGFTSGATTLLNIGPNQFLLIYDLLPSYVQVNGGEDFSTYQIVARRVMISP